MSRGRWWLIAALSACATPPAVRPPEDGLPRSAASLEVQGGETVALRRADVTVLAVLYMNDPCPPGAQCITSGVARDVRIRVTERASGRVEEATVTEGSSTAVQGVLVRVRRVEPGPRAVIELSEALARAPSRPPGGR